MKFSNFILWTGSLCVDWRDHICVSGYRSGLCDFNQNRKCCRPCDADCLKIEEQNKKGDSLCNLVGGKCFHESNYCNGYYSSNKCAGDDTRQCCIPIGAECGLVTYSNSRIIG